MRGPLGSDGAPCSAAAVNPLQALTDAAAAADVEQIALTDLVRNFRTKLDDGDPLDLEEVGEFLVAAARVALVKSSALLFVPAVDDTADGEGVGKRSLGEQPSLAEALTYLSAHEGWEAFPSPGLDRTPQRPVEPRSPHLLRRAWTDMHARADRPKLRVLVPAFLRLENAIGRMTDELKRAGRVSLNRLLHRSSRNDAVVHFLAVLELVRRREVLASQEGLFEEITIEPVEHGRDAASRAG